jgi:hypothetical protein
MLTCFTTVTAVHQAAGHVNTLIAALDEVDYTSNKEE